MTAAAPMIVGIFAHNEEARIGDCLASLPLDDPHYAFYVIVNGARDETAARARINLSGKANGHVLEYAEGGKARSWNRFVHADAPAGASAYFFADGDLRFEPGSLDAMAAVLAENGKASAVAAPPLAGRRAAAYRAMMAERRSLFGGLYLLSGAFVERVRALGLRMPEDVIGEDGMVEAWVKTDLGRDADWDDARIAYCPTAGFYSEQRSLLRPNDLMDQWKRMVRYSERRLQNKAISAVMASDGVAGLPDRIGPSAAALASLSDVRAHPLYAAADWVALQRLKKKEKSV